MIGSAPVRLREARELRGWTRLADRPRRVTFASDQHYPAACPVAERIFLARTADFGPDLVVLGGDVNDCYEMGEYDRPNHAPSWTLQEELDSALDFRRAVGKLAPRVVEIEGNHEHRFTRVKDKARLGDLRSAYFPHAAGFPRNFTWATNQSKVWVGDLVFWHGDSKGRGQGGKNPARKIALDLIKGVSSISGHVHKADRHVQTLADGRVIRAYTVPHLSRTDLVNASYISDPDWQLGWAEVEFDWPSGAFQVRELLIQGGRLKVDGKVYR